MAMGIDRFSCSVNKKLEFNLVGKQGIISRDRLSLKKGIEMKNEYGSRV
jgi:hypothetical protein